MVVRIVCYEDVHEWILGKFALRLSEELSAAGITVDIAKTPSPAADVNHHIIYSGYAEPSQGLDTLMVTHIDTTAKQHYLAGGLEKGAYGICMSSHHMAELAALGISREKLCFINPAHDALASPKKVRIGIASRVYPDGRKREHFISQLAGTIDPSLFSFAIIGAGWEDVVLRLRDKGFTVEYVPEFDRAAYAGILSSIDYYLYTGTDEGQIGTIDALHAGVKTIVPPVGYHLDIPGGITHPFMTFDELAEVFRGITETRRAGTAAVSSWTWKTYAQEHLMLWQYLIARRAGQPAKPVIPGRSGGVLSLAEFDTDGSRWSVDAAELKRSQRQRYFQHKIAYISSLIKNGGVIDALRRLNLRRLKNFFFKY